MILKTFLKTVLLFVLLCTASCAKKGSTSESDTSENAPGGGGGIGDSPNASTTKLYISTSWVVPNQNCVTGTDIDGDSNMNYYRATLTFVGTNSDGTFSSKTVWYSDSTCSSPTLEQKTSGIYIFGSEYPANSGAIQIDFAYSNYSMTGFSSQMISIMNTGTMCGKSDWAIGVEASVTNQGTCLLPSNSYTLVKVPSEDTTKLYFGDPNTGAGTSADTRPTGLAAEHSYIIYQ